MRWLIPLLATTLFGQTITTIAGNGRPGFDASSVNNPYGLAIGPDGALYFCDIDNHVIRRLDLRTKTLTTVAGSGTEGNGGDGGAATAAALKQPYEVVFDKGGNLFFVDMPNHVVRRVERKTGVISTVAGTGTAGFSGDGGPAVKAELSQPHSVVFDRDGALLICDIGNHRVRRVNPRTGVITTFLGTGERKPTPDGASLKGTAFNGPRAIAVDGRGILYLVLREGNAVYRIDRSRDKVTLFAGTGQKGRTGDGGPATQATLNGPKGISLSKNGRRAYLADTENHAIRSVELKTGIISTVAGTGERGDGPDGNPVECKMNRPHGVFAAADGTVYIGDSESHRIRALK